MRGQLKKTKAKPRQTKVKFLADVLVIIILAVVCAAILNGAIFMTTRISGPSMNDTLYGGGNPDVNQSSFFHTVFFGSPDAFGDKVLMVRTRKAQAGDIVVFKHEDEQWVKRVIGVAGDTIEIINDPVDGGYVIRNGQRLDEPYAKGKTYRYTVDGGVFRVTVGEGEIFVLGDNRGNSNDSRVIGCVKTADLVGRVVLVIKKDTKKIVLARNL